MLSKFCDDDKYEKKLEKIELEAIELNKLGNIEGIAETLKEIGIAA
ncbi:hypothetical protein KKC59_00905 [bacterium]|nr:hypothetical protein [bacterium]